LIDPGKSQQILDSDQPIAIHGYLSTRIGILTTLQVFKDPPVAGTIIAPSKAPVTPDITATPPVVQPIDPPSAARMKILAAEDNKTNRLVFSKLVKNLNIDLEFAMNGHEAVEKWTSFKPDLIFMDISMPEMDGKEATRAIRQLEKDQSLGRTTIVALTAHAMNGDDTEILAAGLDYYLTKPFKKDQIYARIRAEIPDMAASVFPDPPAKLAQAASGHARA
jgi:CheY-like chemotaxis protein